MNKDYFITDILNEDGTKFDPPGNPLIEKWDQLYPPTRYGKPCGPTLGYFDDGRPIMNYGCVLCCEENCRHSSAWKCPEEDREIYTQYQKDYADYIEKHNPNFIVNVNKMLEEIDILEVRNEQEIL